MQDVLETDLIVLWGTNVANNQPVFTKYLYLARKRGARVVVVNPYLEPGLERYWVPSNAESALFGTKLCDLHVPVRPEGDVALANAVLQRLIERDAVDREWIAAHTEGWDELASPRRRRSTGRRCSTRPASTTTTFERFVDLYAGVGGGGARLEHGDHPAHPRRRGRAGDRQRRPRPRQRRARRRRADADPRPLRRAGRRRDGRLRRPRSPAATRSTTSTPRCGRERWGFDVPGDVGLTAPEMVEAAERGELDVLFVDGSNLLEVMPDPPRVEARARAGAAARAPGHRR